MNRRTLVGALLISSCLGTAARAEDPASVALLKSVTGDVRVVRPDLALDARAGMALAVDDRVVTGADATAAITFRDGTRLTLGPGADVHVRAYVFQPQAGSYDLSLFLAKGSAVYASGRIGKLRPAAVKVDTPTGTVGVRGTRFIVDAQ